MCTKPQTCWQLIKHPGRARVATGNPLKHRHPKFKNELEKMAWFRVHRELATPCGLCTECNKAKSMNWIIRNYCELHTTEYVKKRKSYFLTFTYDNEHLPLLSRPTKKEIKQGLKTGKLCKLTRSDIENGIPGGTLLLQDMTNTIKRMRQHFGKFRYYYVGEYGENGTLRPHFHMCAYGLTLDEFQFVPDPVSAASKNPYFRLKQLNDVWENGDVLIGDLTVETIAYVCKYITKAVHGESDNMKYMRKNTDGTIYHVNKESGHMSKDPALGSEFFKKYHSDFDHPDKDYFVLPGGIQCTVPAHFMKMITKMNLYRAIAIKNKRQQNWRDRSIAELEYQEQYNLVILKSKKRDKQ